MIGRSADAFAVIEPPIARNTEWNRAVRNLPGRVLALDWLVRAWQFIPSFAPAVLAMLVAVPFALVSREGALVALVLVLAGVALATADMIVGVARLTWSLLRSESHGLSDSEIFGGELRGHHWTRPNARPWRMPLSRAHLAWCRSPADGTQYEITRGPRPETASDLLSHARVLGRARTPVVHFGPALSLNTLVNSAEERARLRALDEEAIAGEMEAAGLYAAAEQAKRDWILVKGISDWGIGKTDEHQALAARHAADLVADLIAQIEPGADTDSRRA